MLIAIETLELLVERGETGAAIADDDGYALGIGRLGRDAGHGERFSGRMDGKLRIAVEGRGLDGKVVTEGVVGDLRDPRAAAGKGRCLGADRPSRHQRVPEGFDG